MANHLSVPVHVTTQIDVAEVIKAAAGSTLGVIALAALVLGAVAYGLFKGSGDRYKLIAFSLLLVGAGLLLTALLQEGQQQVNSKEDSTIEQGNVSVGAHAEQSAANGAADDALGSQPAGNESNVPEIKRTSSVTTAAWEPTSSPSKLPVKPDETTAWSSAVSASEREGWDGIILTCDTDPQALATTKRLMAELDIEVADVTPANKGGFDSNTVMYLSSKAKEGGQAFTAMLGARLNEKITWAQATANGADPNAAAKRLFIYLIKRMHSRRAKLASCSCGFRLIRHRPDGLDAKSSPSSLGYAWYRTIDTIAQ